MGIGSRTGLGSLARRVAAIAMALAGATIASAQIDSERLLRLAVDRVKSNTLALKRLTCEERTSRLFYLGSSKDTGRSPGNADSDSALPALLQPSFAGRNLFWSDRVRVELSLFNGKDLFSWPGGGKFDADLDSLITNGATLSGVLGPFDVSVLMNDADPSSFRYQGTATAFGGALAEYAYQVPAEESHLLYPDPDGKRVAVSYRGFFLIDPSTGDLRRLCVELEQFPRGTQISRGAVATDYGPREIADTAAFVPIHSVMRLLFKEGQLSTNEMRYVDCRQFQAESTLHFNSVPEAASSAAGKSISEQLPAIPKNRLLKLALDTPIDSTTASTGDAIQAHVTKPLKGKNGRVLVPAGAVVHGRILRLIQYASPYDSVEMVLRFDSVEIGGQTADIRLSPPETKTEHEEALNPAVVMNKERLPVYVVQDASQLATAQDDRKNGTGTFEFSHTDHLHLPRGYITEWTVN